MQLQREDFVRIYLSTMLIKLLMWLISKLELKLIALAERF